MKREAGQRAVGDSGDGGPRMGHVAESQGLERMCPTSEVTSIFIFMKLVLKTFLEDTLAINRTYFLNVGIRWKCIVTYQVRSQ